MRLFNMKEVRFMCSLASLKPRACLWFATELTVDIFLSSTTTTNLVLRIIVSLDSQLLESYRVDKHFRVTSNQHFQSRGIRNGCAVAMRYTATLRCNTTSDRPFRSWLHWSPYPPWCPCRIVSVKLKHNVQRLVTSFEPLAVESTKMTNWWLWLGISSGGSLAQQP